MAAKLFQRLLKRSLAGSKRRKKAGFTLLEILISLLIAGVIISVLLSFVVDLVDTDRREFARSETQREMQTALDLMVADLREAVYIYDRVEVTRGGGVGPLATFIPTFDNLGPSVRPILAFWKVERIPDADLTALGSCDRFGAREPNPSRQRRECDQLQIRRRTYTLVVYYQVRNRNNDPRWKGASRIIRYALPKYTNIANLTQSQGYVDPIEGRSDIDAKTSRENWPLDNSNNNIQIGGRPTGPAPQVLVDFVDNPENREIDAATLPGCSNPEPNHPLYNPNPTNPTYRRVPEDSQVSKSFFVCVKTLNAATSTAVSNQDVVIYLRGNAQERTRRKERLEIISTQAVARGIIDKKP